MVKAIPQQPGFFTAEQANEMLPLVRRIVRDWMKLSAAVEAQQAQRDGLKTLHQTVGLKAYAEELAEVEQSLIDEHDQLIDCRNELESLGLKLHSPDDGSIDFPAILNGREIRLCWRAGEPSVTYWHEIDQPSEQRQFISKASQRIGS